MKIKELEGKKNQVKKKFHWLSSVLILLFVLLAACGQSDAPVSGSNDDELPPAAALEAQAWVADRLGVAVEEVELMNSEQVDWSDSCLGLGGAAESCAAVITPGWQFDFDVNGDQYEVRTDETGDAVRSPQLS